MARGSIQIGDKLRLRSRFFPGHPSMKIGDHSSCMVDLPAGSIATVLCTHGSDVEFVVKPNPNNPTDQGTEIWMTLHMIDVMFEALPAVQK